MAAPADEETARFIRDKAECRAIVARVVNEVLASWKELPEADLQSRQDALTAVFADLAAELATGTREQTVEQFLEFMRLSYEYAETKRAALEDGAFI